MPGGEALRVRAAALDQTHTMKSAVQKRSINLHGHKTSVSLEEDFWSEIKTIAIQKQIRLAQLVEEIDRSRQNSNLSSALRLYVLGYLKDAARAA